MPIIENPAIYVTIEIVARFGTKRLISRANVAGR